MKIKNPFKRLAAVFVTIYARHLFDTERKLADELYEKNKVMYYVATAPFTRNRLAIYDKARFKTEKRVFGTKASLLTLETLKNGCYYHTPDRAGNQAMTVKQIDTRRRYFIRERLAAAKLV